MARAAAASGTDDPPAVTGVNENGSSRYVLLCEHASNHIPARYNKLGLPGHELTRHIAWDIGVAELSRALSRALDAPLFLSGYSRLLIDCNRPPGVPTSIPVISETTVIPGNREVDAEEARLRAEQFYWPFQQAVGTHLDARQAARKPTIVFGVHSFTPVFGGFIRPWHAGVLFRKSVRFSEAMVAALAEPGLIVAANEPYQITDSGDYTVPVHGEARGLDVALIEVRQDLLADAAGIAAWAERLVKAMKCCESVV